MRWLVQGDRNAPHPAGKDNPRIGEAAEGDDGSGFTRRMRARLKSRPLELLQ